VSERNDKVEQLRADIEAGMAEFVEGKDWQWLQADLRPLGHGPVLGSVSPGAR
jgi:hypothetical protein